MVATADEDAEKIDRMSVRTCGADRRKTKDDLLATSAVRRRVRSEPGHDATHLVGTTQAVKGVEVGPFLEQLRLTVEVLRSQSAQGEKIYGKFMIDGM